MPLREERLTVKPSTFKGEAIKGGTQREVKCYICNSPHLIRDCPKKKSFIAMVFEDERDIAQLSSICLLKLVAKEENHAKKGGGLMFVKVKANDQVTTTLIDIGASHNFLSKR